MSFFQTSLPSSFNSKSVSHCLFKKDLIEALTTGSSRIKCSKWFDGFTNFKIGLGLTAYALLYQKTQQQLTLH